MLGDSIPVFGQWFYLHFVENEGMAYGWSFGGDYGKLILSVFRLIAISAIVYYLISIIRKKAHQLLIICVSLILAGAVGNMLDSAFYGLIFSESGGFQLAELFPEQGYASFLHGSVVDMFYFPIYEGYWPDWVPFWGGDYLSFFRPVFNVADASISVGVALLIIFQRRLFSKETKPAQFEEEESIDV